MLKTATAKVKHRFNKIGARSLSVILAASVVVGTIALTPLITSAVDDRVTNYPILSEAVGDTKPTGANWSYNIHDYAETPDFVISNKDFVAPKVDIESTSVPSKSNNATFFIKHNLPKINTECIIVFKR